MANFITTMRGFLTYRGREGQVGFLLHRLTGLGTVLFLTIHILDSALVYFAPGLYQEIIWLYRSTLFGIGEVGLVFCVFYHGVNGLRIAIFDLFAHKLWNIPFQRNSVKLTLLVALLIWIPVALVMLRSLLVHNFGLFGG